jgi:lysozyme family protein
MADAKKLMPHILQWEGGFVNDPDDSGGATMKGVTLATFRKFYGKTATVAQLKAITDDQWLHIFKVGYWDKLRGDDINSQSVANTMVDWGYNSGPATAAKKVQAIVGVVADGAIGPKTIAAINAVSAKELFDKIQVARKAFYENIVKNKPSQQKFLKGWLNRLNSLKFND